MRDMRSIASSVFLERKANVFEQRHRAEQRAVLIHDPELAQDFEPRFALGIPDIVAVEQYSSRKRPIKADHVLQERAFSASRSAQDRKDLAAMHDEIDILHEDLFAKAGVEALDADNRFAAHQIFK
jgi:hypothetical protein